PGKRSRRRRSEHLRRRHSARSEPLVDRRRQEQRHRRRCRRHHRDDPAGRRERRAAARRHGAAPGHAGPALACSAAAAHRPRRQEPGGAALDAFGNLVDSFSGTVQLAVGTNPGNANLLGPPTAVAQSGIATFQPAGLDKLGSGYTVKATFGSLSVTSGPFSVLPLAWQPLNTGLDGGFVQQVAPDPRPGTPTVYAGYQGGVYRSTNGGTSWA